MNDEIEFYINENGIACVPLKLYNDSLEEIERLNKIKKLDIDYNKYLTNEIIKLENIIKEVREYIETKYDYLLGDDTFLDHDERIDRKQIQHILEILDKENK